jgi:pyruvate formate lyase activating enzyme
MESRQRSNANYGTIFKIQRMSTEDGPGIRTTVFFKGCPLTCIWCHNPESISQKSQLMWWDSRCIACGTCVEACGKGVLTLNAAGITIDRGRCDTCGGCEKECPSGALEASGQSWNLNDLLIEIEKDRPYFDASGGGVTVSGGEPTMQPHFVAALLRGCKQRGLKTALDTCGYCSTEALDLILPFCDLVLFDVKAIDSESHEAFTGRTNATILKRLLQIRDRMIAGAGPKELWLRTPIIPDATATEVNITAIGRFISEQVRDVVSCWELCAFNNYCSDKYVRLGCDWRFKNYPLLTQPFMHHIRSVAQSSVPKSVKVNCTGETRPEE